MLVNFVTRSGPHLASHRLRTEVAAQAFPGSVVGPYVPADVHVFSKHWDPKELCLARSSPCSVYDVCDEHFTSNPDALAVYPWIRDYYRRMCEAVDVVTCSSQRLAEVIKAETGRDAVVIEEPYDAPEMPAKFSPCGCCVNLLWFGHAANAKHLKAAWPRLEALFESLEWSPILRAVSNSPGHIQWTPRAQAEQLEWCDLVLLPQSERWKSANRAVTALRAGRYAVADPVDSYEGLCWTGGVLEGIEWVRQNPGSIIERIRSSQAIIRERFSPQRIQEQWYDCISAAAGNTSRAFSM